MQLFFDPYFKQNNFSLNTEESKHCIKVLRHKTGDSIHILDGKGTIYKGIIRDANAKACQIEITEEIYEEKRPFQLKMAVAPTKNMDRFEWFLEKATEIGINEITPIICDHSERKIIKPERLEKIIVSATKQSLKSYKPILNPLIKFQDLIQQIPQDTPSFIAHCYPSEKELLKTAYSQQNNVWILIGPEGDFSEDEVKHALKNNLKAISLGKERLRTETAAIVACTTINIINQMQ